MSYGSYNNYSHGGGGGGYNQRRINEDDVPESKHTIFIRGLPGSISTDEVKDYFEDKIGPVSFDFVKQSPDNQRLFVAVRFETREDAKTAMSRYVDRDLMGYRCELSWFKDIRRYAQYQQAQGRGGGGMNRNNRGGFRGRASYRGGQGYDRSRYDDRDRSRSRDRSRTPHSRDSSRSSRGRSRTRSRSSRSASPARRSRSSSRDSYESRRKSDRDGSLDEERRKRKKDKKHKKRKNRSRSHSHSSEGELKSDDDIRKLRNGVGREPTASPISNRDESESPQRAPVLQGSAPFKFNIKKKEEVAATVQNTAFSIGMDDNDEPPRVIRRLTPDSRGSTKSDLLNGNTGNNDKDKSRSALLSGLPPPPAPPSFHQKEKSRSPARERGTFRPITQQTPPEPSEPPVKRERKEAEPVQVAIVETVVEEQEVEILTPPPPPAPVPVEEEPARPPTPPPPAARKPQPPPVVRAEPVMAPQSSASKYPTISKLFAELRAFQSKIIKDVKAEPKQEEGFGGLRLSSLAMQNGDDDEATKQALREEKLAALDEMQMERFMVHKKKLEAAFRNDCQTFAFVTKQLLSKDESLEQSLRIALIENLEDLEKQLMEKVDAYLG